MHAVVTGATSGIGEAIAAKLARSATVTLVGRDDTRLRAAAARIGKAVPGADLILERADLALCGEVRSLAERLESPDVVVSNAAVITDLDDRTDEGVQTLLATNHLAPYLLLRLLAERIGEGGGRQARFVIVGADPVALARVPVDLDDLESRRLRMPDPDLRPFVAYGRTKNMNAMFCYALARRLTAITVNAVHPGIIGGTGLGRNARGALKRLGEELGRTAPRAEVGAETPVWLATASEVDGRTGGFYVGRELVKTAEHTTDPERCERLWCESAQLVGISDW
ncbi:SDR family NAD(P)-dependent oxidoreductase [Kutzneria kofuensis]|uniref:NAD(P)-dependent dehydrogenase (Short-subunit alcohol dehydrogenase family) n=1 Tax=Kutzneria kofuensis TaxID=103725 RepID=A0A7W9KB71_9PSEU|nr:SDR family NAD(P)-dependent oxidoreductase [Kutzneria kofuensis]MBB5889362.1 NAD(P)-dependent dehydrogenase (short-subunit alcohol dehydrogenase family) [Kutzneria kofuensis]